MLNLMNRKWKIIHQKCGIEKLKYTQHTTKFACKDGCYNGNIQGKNKFALFNKECFSSQAFLLDCHECEPFVKVFEGGRVYRMRMMGFFCMVYMDTKLMSSRDIIVWEKKTV